MATIETRSTKNGATRYRAVIRKKGYPIQRATFTRLTDARKWARQTESAIEEGRHFKTSEAKKRTLGEAIDRYVADVMPQKPRSAKQQTRQLEWWKGRIGRHSLADVTPALIVEHRAVLVREKSASTANRYAAILGHLFTKCVKEWGWLGDSPMRKIERLREPRGRVRFLDRETELPALLDACQKDADSNLYPAVVLALSTGARKNEILGLRWADVDFERGRISLLDTKNGEARSVGLAGLALSLLQERSRIRRIDCDYVFPAPTKAVPADVDRAFARAREAAKIEDFRFHDLRHSAASYLAMNGATLAEIAAVLGHRTLAMVQRYSHLSDAHTGAVVSRMNEAVFGVIEGGR